MHGKSRNRISTIYLRQSNVKGTEYTLKCLFFFYFFFFFCCNAHVSGLGCRIPYLMYAPLAEIDTLPTTYVSMKNQ